MTTGMTFTSPSVSTESFDCTSSLMIPGPSGHYGNTKTTGGYTITTGTLFTDEFWDDESYEIYTGGESSTLATFGD
jgi:hypothetical protein